MEPILTFDIQASPSSMEGFSHLIQTPPLVEDKGNIFPKMGCIQRTKGHIFPKMGCKLPYLGWNGIMEVDHHTQLTTTNGMRSFRDNKSLDESASMIDQT